MLSMQAMGSDKVWGFTPALDPHVITGQKPEGYVANGGDANGGGLSPYQQVMSQLSYGERMGYTAAGYGWGRKK